MESSPNGTDADDRLNAVEATLRRERRRTTDELEALRAFDDRIRSIETERRRSAGDRTLAVATAANCPTTALDAVRESYESTVMSVPHYREEYDDTYAESLAGEFSPDIAAALTDGTAFNDRCKRAVLSAVSTARSSRKSLLEVVDRERESVRRSRDELCPLAEELSEIRAVPFRDKQFGALDAYRARLGVIVDNCEEISDRRQDAIFDQRRIQRLPTEVPDVTVYFYQEIDARYPVISLVAELSETARSIRGRIEREMAFCHA